MKLNQSVRQRSARDAFVLWLAQGFGSGRLPKGPGTWGSVVGVVWTVLLILTGSPWIYLALTALATWGSVWVCHQAEQILQQKDPSSVVIDEIVAVPIAYLGYALVWWWRLGTFPVLGDFRQWWPYMIAAFVLFRVFDIWKPGWIDSVQRFPCGWGVVADDVLAGCVAALVLAMGTVGVFLIWG